MNSASMNQLAEALASREEATLNRSELCTALIALNWGADNFRAAHDVHMANALAFSLEDFEEVTLGATDVSFLGKVLRACARSQPSELCLQRYRLGEAVLATLDIDEMLRKTRWGSPEFEAGIETARKVRSIIREVLALTLCTPPDATHLQDRRAIAAIARDLLDANDPLLAALSGIAELETHLATKAWPSLSRRSSRPKRT